MRSFLHLVAVGSVAVAALSAAVEPASATPPPARPHVVTRAAGTYVPVPGFRAVDTRSRGGALRAQHVRTVAIGGFGGVPRSDVSAVALTITALAPTASGALIVYPTGGRRPGVSSLLYATGARSSAALVSQVSPTGDVNVYANAPSGGTQFALDVVGYYVGGSPSTSDPGVLHPLHPATRALDTRTAGVGIRPGASLSPVLGGTGDMPTDGIGAALVSISVFAPTRNGGLVAFAYGNDAPVVNTTQFAAGDRTTTFATVPTNRYGRIVLRNSSTGTVQVVVDVLAYTVVGVSRSAGTFQARYPVRLVNGTRVGANGTVAVPVSGRGGVPLAGVSAVAVTLSVRAPAVAGVLSAWGPGADPGVVSLAFGAGSPAGDLAIVPVHNGTIQVHNGSTGALNLYVDVVGLVPSTTITPPVTSTSHYLRNLLHDNTDGKNAAKMMALGASDAASHTRLTVLEFGTQSVTDPLSSDNPGVRLTGTDERLTYDEVQQAVQAYINGFTTNSSAPLTVAVGTNNDGAYTDPNHYYAFDRGLAWANQVIGPLSTANDAPITIVGADDIEASFDTSGSGLLHAQRWEDGYYSANPKFLLYFNGSLDNCPDVFGTINATCTTGWTQDAYYNLAHGRHPDILSALPQIYTVSQATQWVNVDHSGGNGIVFAGALTEFNSCPYASSDCPTASYTAPNGWAALVRGLATLPGAHSVPAVSDLEVDANP